MEIGLNLCWLTLYIMMCIYSSQFNDRVYSVELETAVLILIITTIIFSLVIFIANVLIEFVGGPGNKQNIQVQDIIRDKINPGSDVQIKQWLPQIYLIIIIMKLFINIPKRNILFEEDWIESICLYLSYY